MLVITMVVPTEYGNLAFSMMENGNLTPEQIEKLLNYIGKSRQKMFMPVFCTGRYTLDSLGDPMSYSAEWQVVEEKWIDPKTDKERAKWVSDVWVEMEETTLSWSKTNLNVNAANMEAIQATWDRSLLPGTGFFDALGFNGNK
jgi:hypothetical protein